jgi:signal transduction histidine kinase
MKRSASARALLAGGFLAGYLLLDWVSYIHPMQQYSITPWNPQPALAIALLLFGGQSWLPAVFIAAVAAEWLVRGAVPYSASTLLIGAVLTLGYAAIAQAMRGRLSIAPGLESRVDVVRLVGVIAVGAFATGVLYIAALLASGLGPLDKPFEALARFFIGDTVGIMVTLPFLLMLAVPARRVEMRDILGKPETLLHAGATVAALAVLFVDPAGQSPRYFYVVFLPLVAIAVRYGLAGSIIAMLVIQAAVIAAGEFAGLQALTVFEFQALLIALTVTGLFLGVAVDERQRAERELRESLRLAAAGEMAAALAHELNQPLTALANYARASQVLTQSGDMERLEETLAKLVSEAARAAEVVRGLRDFFRTGATRLAPLAVGEVADRVVASLRERAGALGVTLRSDTTPVPSVLADELQLEVVIRNLLVNGMQAAAASQGGREVQLRVTRDADGFVRTTVRDSGSGVAPADAQRIFQPFETSRATGMGMGLAISRAIVAAHGGRLWTEPGDGGVFCFTLPADDLA